MPTRIKLLNAMSVERPVTHSDPHIYGIICYIGIVLRRVCSIDSNMRGRDPVPEPGRSMRVLDLMQNVRRFTCDQAKTRSNLGQGMPTRLPTQRGR